MGRGRRSRLGSNDPIERIPFRLIATWNAAAGSTFAAPIIVGASLTPAIDNRLVIIAEIYQYYRFTSLKFSVMPAITATNDTDTSLGYLPRVPNAAPTTHAEINNMTVATFKSRGQTVPSKLVVPRSIVLGDAPLKWYQTIAGTEDSQFEVQGYYVVASNVVSAAVVTAQMMIVEGVCEFKGRTNAGQTPLYKLPKQPKLLPCATDDGSPFPSIQVGNAVYKLASA